MILERLKKLGTREKLGLLLAAAVMLLLVLDRLLISTVVRQYRELDHQIVVETRNARLNQEAINMEADVYRRYRQVADLVQRVESPAVGIDAMKGQIDDLAARTGVILISREHRKPEEVPHAPNYQHFHVDIREFEATETNLVAFLRMVLEAPGLLRVERMNLLPDRNRGLVKGSMLVSKVMMLAPSVNGDNP